MARHVPATHTEYLTRDHYRALGCFSWNKPRFIRLCAKFNETPGELAARIGLTPSEMQLRFDAGTFTRPEGILLTLLDRTIDAMKSGIPPKEDLFTPISQ